MSRESAVGDALRSLAALDVLPVEQRRLAAEAADKLAGALVYVAVIGEFKRGKSSLINALLGEAVLPTGVLPVTAIPVLVRSGPSTGATVRMLDGTEMTVPVAAVADYATERGNPGNRRRVREVLLTHPAPLLSPGLVLADTPGTGSVHTHNTRTAAAFLPRVDVALLVLSVDAPLSNAEAELLSAAGASVARVAVCLNKVDLLGEADLTETIAFVRDRVAGLVGGGQTPVFAVSSRCSRAGADAGLGALGAYLAEIADGEREAVVGVRARRVAERLLALASSLAALQRAAAAQPVERARAARAALEEARRELEGDAGEAVTLLLAACRQSLTEIVDPDADRLRRELPAVLLALPDEAWRERAAETAEAWTVRVAAALSDAVEDALRRHGERLQERLERFVRRAGEVFAVELPPPPDVRSELRVAPIRMGSAEDAGALAMGVRQVRRHLPGALGRRWREGARREEAAALADRLAGRLGYAARRAVDDAARGWAGAVEGGWRSLSDGFAAAVRGAEEAAGTTDAEAPLGATSVRLEAIRAALRGG